jgi:hypothetical protein
LFGVGYAAGKGSVHVRATFSQHRRVSLAASSSCAVDAASLSLSPTTGSPADTVTVSGPLYYLDEAGNVWVPATEAVQVWWNLDPASWTQAALDAIAISAGQPPTGGNNGGAQMLANYLPNGACSFTESFVVPQVPAGTYPVSIIEAGLDGATLYGSFAFQVK